MGIRACIDQEARAACRREWNGRYQLGVVGEAVLGIRIRPREIKHKLTARVVLLIERQGADRLARCIFEQQMTRGPAPARRDAARLLEREQEFVPQEGLGGAGQPVPGGGIDGTDALENAHTV